jgi:hypothetical protein
VVCTDDGDSVTGADSRSSGARKKHQHVLHVRIVARHVTIAGRSLVPHLHERTYLPLRVNFQALISAQISIECGEAFGKSGKPRHSTSTWHQH